MSTRRGRVVDELIARGIREVGQQQIAGFIERRQQQHWQCVRVYGSTCCSNNEASLSIKHDLHAA